MIRFAPQILRIRGGRAERLRQAHAVKQRYYWSASRRHGGVPPDREASGQRSSQQIPKSVDRQMRRLTD